MHILASLRSVSSLRHPRVSPELMLVSPVRQSKERLSMKLIVSAIVALGVFAGALNASAQASDEVVKSGGRSKAANNIYIVQMSDKPVVSYEG